MRTALISLTLAALASAAPTFSTETIHADAAPVISSSNAESVPDSYIVVFKKHVSESSATNHHLWVQESHLSAEVDRAELRKRSQFPVTEDIFAGIKHTYNIAGGFLGYSGHFDESIIEKVRRHPDVSNNRLSYPFSSPSPDTRDYHHYCHLACTPTLFSCRALMDRLPSWPRFIYQGNRVALATRLRTLPRDSLAYLRLITSPPLVMQFD